jgi:pilus assembly protein CpaE
MYAQAPANRDAGADDLSSPRFRGDIRLEGFVSTTVVSANPKNERVALLAKLLTQLGQEVTFAPNLDAAQRAIKAESPEGWHAVIVPDEHSDNALAESAANFSETEAATAFVVYVADDLSVETYKRLVRSGRGEWIKWQTLPREIIDVLQQLNGARAAASAPRGTATVIGFLPSKGGVGNTSLAVESAVCLASKKNLKGRVAVLDLNFRDSSLGDYLDIESRFDVTEIMNRPERLDAQLVDIFASTHSSSVDVFSSPSRYGHDDRINADVIFALLDQVGGKYDILLLDLPTKWQPWVDNILLGSSGIVVTGEPTVPGVRQISSRLKHLADLEIGTDRTCVVVNKCETNFFGRAARKTEIERSLGGHRALFVPNNSRLAAEAANTGRPMVQAGPGRSTSKSIRCVASWIEAVRGVPASAR